MGMEVKWPMMTRPHRRSVAVLAVADVSSSVWPSLEVVGADSFRVVPQMGHAARPVNVATQHTWKRVGWCFQSCVSGSVVTVARRHFQHGRLHRYSVQTIPSVGRSVEFRSGPTRFGVGTGSSRSESISTTSTLAVPHTALDLSSQRLRSQVRKAYISPAWATTISRASFSILTGSSTRLGATRSAYGSPFTVTFSPLTGRLYTAVSDGASTRINVFPGDASGNVAPLRTIAGPATGLTGLVVTGLADDPCQGNIYALSADSVFGKSGRVLVFGRLAQGNVAPLRRFTETDTHLADSRGMAFAPLTP